MSQPLRSALVAGTHPQTVHHACTGRTHPTGRGSGMAPGLTHRLSYHRTLRTLRTGRMPRLTQRCLRSLLPKTQNPVPLCYDNTEGGYALSQEGSRESCQKMILDVRDDCGTIVLRVFYTRVCSRLFAVHADVFLYSHWVFL